jgi:hypothetical protein
VIHYHGTPCGGQREQVARFLSGRHALIPWVRDEDIGTAADVCQSFCLDNGAFTAWKQGEPITDWSGYYKWVREWALHPGFDFAIIPDVIDGSEKDNDDLIARWDKTMWHPVYCHGAPVWHMHESLERLDRLCRHFHRVCLGSSGEYTTPGTVAWWERIGEAMKFACNEDGRPKTKLHGLRMLDPAIFHRLPLSSADSTNAVRNGSSVKRFGMYCPPSLSTRQTIIAERIEQHQSASYWISTQEQGVLAFALGEQT